MAHSAACALPSLLRDTNIPKTSDVPSRNEQAQSEQVNAPSSSAKLEHTNDQKVSLAGMTPGSVPIYVHSNTINSANTFLTMAGAGAYVAAPMFAAIHEGLATSSMRPAYEWQVDPITGYVTGLYSNGLLSAQNTGISQQPPISYGQATPYHHTIYGLHNAEGAHVAGNGLRFTGQLSSGEHKKSWTTSSGYKFKVNSPGYANRRTFKPGSGWPRVSASDKSSFQSHAGSTTTTESQQGSPRSTNTQTSSDGPSATLSNSPTRVVGTSISMDILAKLANGNAIPPPVPSLFACSSAEDALESSLYNPNQTTNVYIRGLPPDTTDEKLHEICERFGEITSSKAILEVQTNTCKGFGFACFRLESEAAACIAGLLHCGYQVSFAKESFSTRLKNLQDPQSTNLYLSNLPSHMHEKDLELLFAPYEVISNRILRDSNNVSRGVGFARLSDRQSAEAIIEKFDNKPLEGDINCLPLQVRFADSPNQKKLKGQTQRRRQWRAREYNLLTGNLSYADFGGEVITCNDTSRLYMNIDVPKSGVSYDVPGDPSPHTAIRGTSPEETGKIHIQKAQEAKDLLTTCSFKSVPPLRK